MDTILRVAFVYLFLVVILRLMGKREFGQFSPFEFVNLLVISELVQQAMIRDDFSLGQVKVALLESEGNITFIPRRRRRAPMKAPEQ